MVPNNGSDFLIVFVTIMGIKLAIGCGLSFNFPTSLLCISSLYKEISIRTSYKGKYSSQLDIKTVLELYIRTRYLILLGY